MSAALEGSADGAFDLDGAAAPRVSSCVVCLEGATPLVVASCGAERHGICRGCLAAALLEPSRRNPVDRADGSMGCVAAGCGGSWDLRQLLDVLDTPDRKRHLLTHVASLRKKGATTTGEEEAAAAAPDKRKAAAAAQTATTDPPLATDARKLSTKRNQLLAAVDFMRKPSICGKPAEAIDEYLRTRGQVPEDVVAAARDVVSGLRALDAIRFDDEEGGAKKAAAVPSSSSSLSSSQQRGTTHAPAFYDLDDAAERIDAIWAEQEVLRAPDIASLLWRIEETKKKTVRRALKDRVGAAASAAAATLEREGWAVLDGFCSVGLVDRVLREVEPVEPFYTASEIWVGADSSVGAQMSVPSVRGDKVLWMCGAHPRAEASADFTRAVQERGGVEPCETRVKCQLAATLKAGAARLSKSQVALFPAMRDLFRAVDAFILNELVPRLKGLGDVASRSDAMLAIFPGDGSRFQAHVDNTTLDGRKLTVLCYLNADWKEADGGAIRLHGKAGPKDVAPRAGRLAIFFSDKTKHEVRPCHAKRVAVTLWYYGDAERRAAVDRSNEAGDASNAALEASDADRLAAQAFARELCAPAAADADQANLDDLARKAALLPRPSQQILAGMAGVPETHFVTALKRLQPAELDKLRTRFAKMGV